MIHQVGVIYFFSCSQNHLIKLSLENCYTTCGAWHEKYTLLAQVFKHLDPCCWHLLGQYRWWSLEGENGSVYRTAHFQFALCLCLPLKVGFLSFLLLLSDVNACLIMVNTSNVGHCQPKYILSTLSCTGRGILSQQQKSTQHYKQGFFLKKNLHMFNE